MQLLAAELMAVGEWAEEKRRLADEPSGQPAPEGGGDGAAA